MRHTEKCNDIMELSTRIKEMYEEASEWWNLSGNVSDKAEDRTIALVYNLLKEVGKVEFDEFHRELARPYMSRFEGWKIGQIKELYIDKDEAVVAKLVDGTETYFEDFIGLNDSSMWCSIMDSLGSNN